MEQEIVLNSPEDIDKCFKSLTLEEERLEDELKHMLSQQFLTDARIANIAKALPSLEIIHSDSKRLSEMITHTSMLAENISAKVRKLDLARSRVSECQQRVHDLLDLQLCSSGVEDSLVCEDFEKAAAHIHRYLSMDQRLLEKTADDMQQDCTSVSNSITYLQEAASKLQKIITEKYEEAIKRDDSASVERFFKLFPLIGPGVEPLKIYSRFLTNKIDAVAKKQLKSALNTSSSDKRYPVIFADVITMLFEDIAKAIETQQPIVETYYGPGMLINLVEVMQEQCDSSISLMVNEMKQVRSFEQLQISINSRHNHLSKPDPKEIDVLLAEITSIHSRYKLYEKFICRKVEAENGEPLLRKSRLCSVMHDLLAYYLSFEQYYMAESVKKAISMDTVDPNSLISSMVDDVFFIVKKSIRRASISGSIDGVCAVINMGVGVLETELAAALDRTLRQGFPSAYLDLTQAYNVMIQGKSHIDSQDTAKNTFMKHLNNTEISVEYVGTLAEGLSYEMRTTSESERAKLEGCLSGLSSVTVALSAARDIGLQQLRIAAIKPRIAPWIDFFTTLSHQFTEEEFSAYEANEPFTRSLIGHLDSLLTEFKEILTPQNYDNVVSIIATEIASHLERVILKTEFNRYGGLALDKEVRCLISYLSGATSWAVRDKFARLSQIATILNVERVPEMIEYWRTAAVTWRLTASEAINLLRLRTDFSNHDISRLRL